jgi:thiazole synthase
MSIVRSDKPFVLAGRTFQSRLLVGTGKYRDMEEAEPARSAVAGSLHLLAEHCRLL